MKRTAVPPLVHLVLMLMAVAGPVAAGVEVLPEGVRFSYTDPVAGQVTVAGEFNAWSTTATPMVLEDGVWTVTVKLDPGKHEYKYVVDGQWTADPENPYTTGAYGNSVVEISASGTEVKQEATSNTALSPKILLGGRFIGLYISRENAGRGRQYELIRPVMDIDLDWKVRVNEVTNLHMLTKINNENEKTVTDFWRTNLRFDRGSIRLHTDRIEGKLFDNESVGRWDDPWNLVGSVGIFDHDFGYREQGAIGTTGWGKAKLTLLYSDDFENGGTTNPGLDTLTAAEEGTFLDSTSMTYGFTSARTVTYVAQNTDNDKDVFALRGKVPFGGVTLGSSFRLDRGYNPGSLSLIDIDPADPEGTAGVQRNWTNTVEEWWGGGGDLLAGGEDRPYTFQAEFLYGRADVVARDGSERDVRLTASATYDEALGDTLLDPVIVVESSSDRPADLGKFRLDRSYRYYLGGSYRFEDSDFEVGAGWARETHDQSRFATGVSEDLENSYNRFDFTIKQVIPDARDLTVAFEAKVFDFYYDERTPWENQFWFDKRNFWLDQGEHEVEYDRMTLVGGRDASILKPSLSFELSKKRRIDFTYLGTIAGEPGKEPKYVESLFQVLGRPWRQIRLYSDTRLVKYNDPVLDLFGSYWCTFAEVAYEMGKGMEIAFSYGVDPYVIDDAVNKYDYIGRDLFLFAGGADGEAARRAFTGLSETIPDAEQALEDERRFQIEGIVRF